MNGNKFKDAVRKIGALIKKAAAYTWKRCRHNLGLKIISLIFSIIFCNLLLAQTNPQRRLTLTDVPVAYTGLQTLEANDLTLSEESRNLSPTITVTLQVPMKDFSKVTKDRVAARVDLSTLRETGEQEALIRVTTDIGSVSGQSQEMLRVNVEDLITKTVPVELTTEGTMPAGYSISSTSLSPNVIMITGPRASVMRVCKARVTVDVSQITNTFSGSESFVLVDDEDNELETGHLEMSAAGVILSATVRKSVTLPVDAEQSLTGAEHLADGYELEGVEVIPASITVSGAEKSLEGVKAVACSAVDVAGLSENRTFSVDLKPIGGLTYSTNSVEVVVHIRQREMTRVFEHVPVNVVNIGSGLTMNSTVAPVRVTVTGPESVVTRMNVQNLNATVDARDLLAGVHSMNVKLTVDEAYAADIEVGDLSAEPGQVSIDLREIVVEPDTVQ